jgi:hypothetical protein
MATAWIRTLTQILDTQEVWIAPIWNPDGYVYVFEQDNTWRKNRRDNGDGTFGVDQNRNYPLRLVHFVVRWRHPYEFRDLQGLGRGERAGNADDDGVERAGAVRPRA